MKKIDYLLISIGIPLMLLIVGGSWVIMLKFLLGILLIAFVTYWKIIPYKTQLAPRYQKTFGLIERVSQVFINALSFLPKFQLGQRLQLDMSYIVIIIIFVITLIIL